MNNNQFKAFIRDRIEILCKERDLKPIYIDTTSNSRTYYIYDNTFRIKCTMSVWTGNTECSVRVSYDNEKLVSLANWQTENHSSYMKLSSVVETITNALNTIKSTEVKEDD